MEALLDGYRRFRANGWPERRTLFEALAAQGQHPRALVLGCIDSRVDPGMIFDAAPGEILVVRNIANLIPPYAPDRAYHGTSAALEFGARILGVSQIIVLGHGMCGGVRTLLEGAPEQARDFIGSWMAMARPARERVGACDDPAERQRRCEYEVIKLSLANMMSFPWIAERVAQKALTLHGAWFAIHTGTLAILQPDGSFQPA